MSRKYWLDISIRVADGEDNNDNAGYAAGGRIDLDWSDEGIRDILDMRVDYIMEAIDRLREVEAERERKAAAPFWKKWLGGV